MERVVVGAAIAAFNCRDRVRECLAAGRGQWTFAVVVDDGSTDGTSEMLAREFPEVQVISGNGSLWWAGGTNRAVSRCLECGADYVLVLNPDVVVSPGCVEALLATASTHRIAAALVVSKADPGRVAWAGSRWGRLAPRVPVYTSRYNVKSGTPVTAISRDLLPTDEVHGRAVAIARTLFETHGSYDDESFPHYGADSDFSLRMLRAGVPMVVVTRARALLDTEHSGMARSGRSLASACGGIWRYLTAQKNGDAARVWWRLLRRHVPAHAVVPSWIFLLSLNVARRLSIHVTRAPRC